MRRKHDFIKQEAAAENFVHVDTPNPGNHPQAMTIKTETPEDELDDITVKGEPIDWDQEPQVSSSLVSSALTCKREVDEACAEPHAGPTEEENKVMEGGSEACNTSTIHPQSAGESQESTDSLAPDVFCTNSDVEVRPDGLVTQPSVCELCDSATVRKNSFRRHLCSEHNLGVSFKGELSGESELSLSSDSENKSLSSYVSSSEEGDDAIVHSADWMRTGKARQPFAFIADPGVKFEVEDKSSPIEFFDNYFDGKIVELIVTETNRLAKQTIEAVDIDSLPTKARLRGWFDTSPEEMKLYFALLILQGVDSKNETRFYFGKRECVRNPLFPKVMSARSKQTDYVGTLRLNRKDVPRSVNEAKLKKTEVATAFKNKTMVLKWKDRREVTVLSTIHDDAMVKTVSRRGLETEKPKVIVDYNANMGGVDLSDGLLHHYTTARLRMKKFYLKIFRYLLDMSVLNAYIAYKVVGGAKTRVDFIMTLSEELIAKYKSIVPIPSSSAGRPIPIASLPSRLIGRHFPDYCPATNNRAHAQRNCAHCQKQKKRKATSIWCPECSVGLCISPCFRLWHTQP
ncbi:PiggyBac transposable element-derived protein 4 C-terminal zinc-ribbon [Trinorchestia longiramus]|nr:PiggyBac transposable element-derived protein 4 C-terminal zinc-ribbon [Trinorchestia longiramus]